MTDWLTEWLRKPGPDYFRYGLTRGDVVLVVGVVVVAGAVALLAIAAAFGGFG